MRIGIVTKPALADARPTLADIEAWLREHQVEAVWSPEAADLLPPAQSAARCGHARRFPDSVDLVLVLGGDGTLLAMADRIGRRTRHPDPRRQLRLARLPHRDHAARAVRLADSGGRAARRPRRAHDAARRPSAARPSSR